MVAVLGLAFALLPLVPARRGTAQAPTGTYGITDLGTLGGTESVAYGINNCAQVVGDASLSGASPKHPFIWKDANSNNVSDPGEMQDLGTFQGGSGTASAINSSAYVAGDSVHVDSLAFLWSTPGPLQSLGVLPGDAISLAYDINDTNQLVGLSESAFLTDRAFIWQNSVMTEVPILNSIDPMIARGINNSGKIVGIARNLHAFIYTGATNVDLGTFGGNLSWAYEVSDDDRVVGYAETTSNNANVPRRAFIWHDDNSNNVSDAGELKNLGTLGGTHSAAYDLTSGTSPYVVGSADIAVGADPRRAFIWHDANGDGDGDDLDDVGEMRDLNLMLAPPDPTWTLIEARSINDGGQIVGFGLKSGQIHAFLLTPTGYTPPPCPSATPTVTVAVSPSAVAEDGLPNLVYTFTRTGSTASSLTINFSVGGDAAFGSDYTQTGAATFDATSGTVTFGAGSATAIVTLDPTADTSVEIDEAATLTVTSGAGYDVGSPSAATGTITNDDTSVSVAVLPPSVAEDGAPNLVYTFTRTGVISGALTVNFSVGGPATLTTDYSQSGAATFSSSSGSVTITAGMPSASVTIHPVSDAIDEPNETVDLTVTSGTGYVVGAPNSASGTITDDDGTPAFSISDVTLAEGNSGPTAFTFTVTKTGATALTSTVNFATADGTAQDDTPPSEDSDYQPTSGMLSFDPADMSKTITVNVNGDSSVETDETFFVNLSNPTNATISGSQGTGTINNDDTDVTVAVSPSSVAEDGSTNLVYTFSRNGVTSGALTVNFSVGGTAAFSSDYTQTGAASFTPPSGSVTFAPNSATATVTVDPTTDTTIESDETVVLTVTSGSYNIGSPGAATGTITNDDADVTVAVSPSSGTEDGATNLVYTFTRNGVTGGALTVNFSVGGGATFNTDYTQTGAATFTATSGTVTFAAGSSTATVTIDPTSDTTVEPDDNVILTVTSGTGYNIGSPNAATGTITNDDTDVSVAVSPLSVIEDGATNLVYTFTRNGVTSGSLTVNFSVGGTADSSNDYTQTGAASFTASSGSVTFAAASTTTTVTIDPTAEVSTESDETVILTVTSGAGYNVANPSAATGTITNDDTDVTISVSPSSVAEDGATNLVYIYTRTGVTSTALTINIAVAGTATFGTDYTQTGAATFSASSGTVNFAAESATATVTVDPTPDSFMEQDESVILFVASGTGYNVALPGTIEGLITNDDAPLVQLSATSYSVNEGSLFATINVTRTGDTSAPVTVKYATSDATDVNFACNPTTAGQITGAASRKCDYHIAVGRLRFAAGETTKQIILSVVDDVYAEGTEVLTLTLSDAFGISLGSPSTATINIIDNDSVTGTTNPIDGTSFYVRMLYVDLLSREPDPAGFAGWVHRIDFCGQPGEPPPPCDRVTVGGDGFLRSGEFFDRQFFVLRLYRAGLGRILIYPEVGDLAYVSGFLSAADLELNKQDLVTEIMSRPEFSNTYNGLGDAAYVDKLIQTAAVTIPQSVRDGWVTALNANTKTRAQVYRELSERQEVSDRYLHEAQVVSCYYGFFTRNPDGAYFSYLDRLDRGEINLGDLANAFINASEYKQRFGP